MNRLSYLFFVGAGFALSLLTSCNNNSLKERAFIQIRDNWQFSQAGKEEWNPASVPGCVHTDLLSNKLIEDPFYRTNEKDLQWISDEDWIYKTTINADAELLKSENLDLLFKGLDTYADVFLNGELLLSTDNMFKEWRADCKRLLKEGDNELKIYFKSAIKETLPLWEKNGFEYPANNDQAEKKVSIFSRKAPYHYGWDWGPRFVTSGIWRPVYLDAWNSAKLSGMQIVQDSLSDDKAELTAHVEIEATEERNVVLQIKVNDEVTTLNARVPKGSFRVPVKFSIDAPRKWWPAGLGEQYLYEVSAELKSDDKLLDKASSRIGLRTVEFVHEKDAQGKSYYFKVNGAPVFMKGANYIPSDNFLNRVDRSRYEFLINSTAEANMNMLRVWGGGIYEEDIFYDLCDEKGILVFQDFIFGCSMYPGDDKFLASVKDEAVYNVKRLRNHPSIALWCGNNEQETAWFDWGWQRQFNYSSEDSLKIWNDYKKLFHEILPSVVQEYDPSRAYVRSSPSANEDDQTPNRLGYGDMHYWGVWHAEEPFEKFKDNTSRFMSEYGFQSFPEFKTVKQYTVSEDWDIESPVMLSHQRHPRGNQLIREYMQRDYKTPKNFEHFLYVSQILQAEGMKIAAEQHRRSMPYCMGTLYWQLEDCWPVASWAGIDFYGRWKALHYYAAKFYNQTIISPTEDNGILNVFVVTDRLSGFDAEVKLTLMDFSGKVLNTKEMKLNVEGNRSKKIYNVRSREFLKGNPSSKVFLLAEIFENGKLLHSNIYHFTPVKNLDLPKGKIDFSVSSEEDGIYVELSSAEFKKNVFLTLPDADCAFSDNYFDLLPSRPVKVKVKGNVTAEQVKEGLKMISLRDTY